MFLQTASANDGYVCRAGVPAVPAGTPAAAAAWWAPLNQQLASTRQHLARVATDLQAASKAWKAPDFSKGLGVKLDIDMLSPAVSTVKQQYQALPEPLREVMPFAGKPKSIVAFRRYSGCTPDLHAAAAVGHACFT